MKKTTDYAMNSSYCADELNISFVKKIVHVSSKKDLDSF